MEWRGRPLDLVWMEVRFQFLKNNGCIHPDPLFSFKLSHPRIIDCFQRIRSIIIFYHLNYWPRALLSINVMQYLYRFAIHFLITISNVWLWKSLRQYALWASITSIIYVSAILLLKHYQLKTVTRQTRSLRIDRQCCKLDSSSWDALPAMLYEIKILLSVECSTYWRWTLHSSQFNH